MRYPFALRVLLSLAMIFGTVTALWAATWAGKVVGVSDGDTLTVLSPEQVAVRIRVNEIDAPEKAQPFGMRAKQALSDLTFSKMVVVHQTGIDPYGRTLAALTVDGKDVAAELVRQGMVWVFRRYTDNPTLIALEGAARKSHAGLWADPSPQPPWEYRHPRAPRQGVAERAGGAATQPAFDGRTCGAKTYCKEMLSCAEARFYLETCGLTRLDADGDAIPCESLCAPQ